MTAVTLQRYPASLLNASPAVYDRFAACHNPMLFKWFRYDFSFTNVGQQSGFCAIPTPGFPAGIPTPTDAAGDLVYITSAILPSGVYTLIAAYSGMIVINLPYVSGYASATGTINSDIAYDNWHLEIKVYNYVNNAITLFDTLDLYPAPDGYVNWDPSSWLQQLMATASTYAYTNVNEKDAFLSAKYTIGYTIKYTGSALSEVKTTDLYCVNASLQVGSLTDEVMDDYCVWCSNTLANHSTAKFLTEFDEPVLVESQDFDLGFIYSDELPYGLQKVEKQYDINGNLLNTITTNLASSQQKAVNRLKPSGSYASGTDYITIHLQVDNSIIISSYIQAGYIQSGYII
jgi:hypothetical protein